jgi:hypothetical protein
VPVPTAVVLLVASITCLRPASAAFSKFGSIELAQKFKTALARQNIEF